MAKGLGEKRPDNEESFVPVVGWDYFFITPGSVHSRIEFLSMCKEDPAEVERQRAEGKAVKCLIGRCHQSKVIFVHVIPRKGLDEERFVEKLVLADL